MTPPRHILVLRFSALGDIAMTVPIIKNLLSQNPDVEISYISVSFVKPLFANIERLHFYPIDIKKYKGIFALLKVARLIKSTIPFDAVADLHDVLRTKIIRFFLGQKNTAVIDKGRKDRQKLIGLHNKILRPLKTMFERYADVFRKLGIPISFNVEQGIAVQKADMSLLLYPRENYTFIGIAPFAKHKPKLYPLVKMEEVISLLSKNENNKIVIFGSKEELQNFAKFFNNSNIISFAANLSLSEELNLISQLDLMVTMDSANMHLASLVGTPVISLWGGTHPFAGFHGWGQDFTNIIQTDLPCRPSSIFGNKKCPIHGEAGCMQKITPELVTEKISNFLESKRTKIL